MKSQRTAVAMGLVWILTGAPCIYAAEPEPVAPAAAAGAVPAASAAAPPPAAIQAAGEERITLNFRAAPIEEVFYLLSQKDKVNIIVSNGVTGRVTVSLYNVTTQEAIHIVANAAGYWVEMRNGNYVILGKETSLDLPASNTLVKTLKVQYSDPKQIADLLVKYASRYGKITPLIGRKFVVVEDLPGFVERIERLLEELDVQPKQVMIEARILEISLDESERFGINWRQIFGSGRATSGSFGTSGLATGSAVAPGTGFFFSLVNRNLTAFFEALAVAGRVRTLSTPKLLALENQESKVIIGDSTGYKVTTTINLVTTESIQFLESGVILKVNPSIDQRGRILLKVQPEVSTASLNAGIPSKRSTQVTTELICEDGQSIFIAGLIRARSATDRSGVPVLRDVPLFGGLFSSREEAVATAETVVIITPYIVSQPGDAAKESADKLRQTDRASGLILEQQLRLERGRPIP